MPRRTAAAVLLSLLATSTAHAWNKPGHMIVAGVAYDVLKAEHPDVIPKLVALLHQHPEWAGFDKLMSAPTVPADAKDEYLMMLAARWPDDVRDKPGGYSHTPWHYVDFPIVFPADHGKVHPAAPDKENALTALDAEAKQLRNATDPGRKAVALCWVEHLVGDLHQPLHTTSLYSEQFPTGDRGGNGDLVRTKEVGGAVNLHSLWDGLMTLSQTYKATSQIATALLARPEFKRDKLPELKDGKPYDWAWESYRVAVHVAYLDGALKAVTFAGRYPTAADKAAAPQMPASYPQDAKAAAERRVVLAGYRLADTLAAEVGK